MNVIGIWKVSQMLGFDEDFNEVWKNAADILTNPDGDEDEKQMASTRVEFSEDGIMSMMMPLPDGVSQEEIDAAVEAGEIKVKGNMMISGEYAWKEEDGKILYDTGITGEILGEEASSWDEITETEDGIKVLTFKLVKA